MLLLVFTIGKAQNYIPARIAKDLNPPTVIVDSVEMDQSALSRINPNDIESINVLKDISRYPNGAIYITLKNHKALATLPQEKWLSLKEISNKEIVAEDQLKPRIYVLDGRLVTDTTNVKIQPSRYHHVRVVSQSEAPYFKTALPNVLLIVISTMEPPKQLMIRGTARD